jgi:hypothetical protein
LDAPASADSATGRRPARPFGLVRHLDQDTALRWLQHRFRVEAFAGEARRYCYRAVQIDSGEIGCLGQKAPWALISPWPLGLRPWA